MEFNQNQFKIKKEKKRHKSANIPNAPMFSNNINLNDFSDNGSTDSTNGEIFKLQTNSLFAYQEFDEFSSFCDIESNNDNSQRNMHGKNNCEDKNAIKDDLSKTNSTYSLKESNEEYVMDDENKGKKRKSAFDLMPPYYAQYLGFQNQNQGNIINNINNNIINISNFINNPFTCDIRRTNTEKTKNNYDKINFFQANNFVNSPQEQVISYENRRRSHGFDPMISYNNAYNPNYNTSNNFNNIFYSNVGNNEDNNNNIYMNSIEQKDFLVIITESPENSRKKKNSLKPNTIYNQNQINQFISNPQNNINYYYNKNNNNKKIINKDNKNFSSHYNIFYVFQDQSNCRNMQEQLEIHKDDLKYTKYFLDQIKPELINLIKHQFGNYVIQKLIDIIIYQENKPLMNELISALTKDETILYEISINNFGTRVIQKTLERLIEIKYHKIETPELTRVLNKLIENHLYKLCCDKNGNHVYQKLLRMFHDESEEKNNFLYSHLEEIALEVALLQQGATIFNTALSLCNSRQKEKICFKIIENIERLINDKYGIYSIQAIINKIEENEKELNAPIYTYIADNIVELSKKKFSSNVLDTFIKRNNIYSKKLVNFMIENDSILKEMVKDQYGNYVVQKALNISDDKTFMKIIKIIKGMIPELVENNIGRKIYEKLSEQYSYVFND